MQCAHMHSFNNKLLMAGKIEASKQLLCISKNNTKTTFIIAQMYNPIHNTQLSQSKICSN